jgi:4'-phosphopantetheinyl transferase
VTAPAAAATDLPAEGELHVWSVELDAEPAVVRRAAALLSTQEREHAQRLLRGRERFVVRRAAVRAILAGYAGVEPDAVAFAHGPRGKPAVAGVEFSSTSSAGRALVAVGASPVGIDLELRRGAEWQPMPERRYLAAGERAALEGLPPSQRNRRAALAWVAKEAIAKALGVGFFALPPDEISLSGDPEAPAVALGGGWREHAPEPPLVGAIDAGSDAVAAAAVLGPCEGVWELRFDPASL